MERYSMFLGRKNQYCENDCTTKHNIQIQCDPYQITSGIFHRTRTKYFTIHQFSSVTQVMSDSLWPHGLQHAMPPCPSPSPRVYPNSCLLSQWCHPTICCPLLLLPSIFPSIRVFSNESALLIRLSKYWSFSFNISPSDEHSGLISIKMDWLDLPEVQMTLQALLQHHSSKASILWCSAFFIVLLSHPCWNIKDTK